MATHAEPVALKRYDAACRAIALAKSTDEVKTIRNAAIAMKAYARQAKNRQLEKDAIAVRMQAERRVGELIKAQRESVGLNHGARGNAGGRGNRNVRVKNEPTQPTLADAGIDKNLADRARKLAKMPAPKFEALVESVRTVEGANVHFSSEKPEHYTPRVILDAVAACLGAIDLDPCSDAREQPNVQAAQYFTRDDNGLVQTWRGRVYMNPPYGREIDAWSAKLCESYEHGDVTEALALLPARTDTQWFRRLRDYVCCFIEGRLTFVGNNDPAPFPSVVFYLGDDLGKFYEHFHGFGDIYQRVERGVHFGE
jgi:hypothetical protein